MGKRRDYVVEGGELQCSLGTEIGKIAVTSQQKVKIKDKLKATNKDKTLGPPFFKNCKCNWFNPPCAPNLKEWQLTSKKAVMGSKTFVMKNSKIECAKGGKITVKDTGQTLVGTGKDELELDKTMPKLEGEILFINGYLSSSIGGALNAISDINPDLESSERWRGKNVDEEDRINPSDVLTADHLEKINEMNLEETEADRRSKALVLVDRKITYLRPTLKDVEIQFPIMVSPPIPFLPPIITTVPIHTKVPTLKKDTIHIDIDVDIPDIAKPIPLMTQQELKSIFWGYWNGIANKKEGSKTYAKHFNAERNEHFFNGSHGLGSNAAHRIDHGIAQGYHWAKYQWAILPKKEVEEGKEAIPYIESYSPAYKPITIVMHSQGNAPGAGIALGILKYANELGWEQIPLNMIYLGVHQPKNLWGSEYDNFIKAKVNHYGADTNFWDTISPLEKSIFMGGGKLGKAGVLLKEKLTNTEDKNILEYLNGISELFSKKHHKLRNKRGIYEHIQAISNFEALKKRAVQFTFSNDRGDMVIRDGDIPQIKSACNPKRDSTLYSVEFFESKVPEQHTSSQDKEVIPLENGGFLVIPPYAAIPRIKIEKGKKKEFWKDYRSVATDWGNAISKYKQLKKQYEELLHKKVSLIDVLQNAVMPLRKTYQDVEKIALQVRLKKAFRKMVYHYARIQQADLYAHFSPVDKIHNDMLLANNKDYADALGNTNVWERIKKAGSELFYRVEYTKKINEELSEEAKRNQEKEYVEGKGKKLLIDTSLATDIYIHNVLKAYVEKDASYEKYLYHEPSNSDIALRKQEEKDRIAKEKLQRMFGQDSKKWQQVKEKHDAALLKQTEVKQDNTRVLKPIIK